MSNNPASKTADRVFEERAYVRIHNVDPASNRANHSHPWELATYMRLIAGRGKGSIQTHVRRSEYRRRDTDYSDGKIL